MGIVNWMAKPTNQLTYLTPLTGKSRRKELIAGRAPLAQTRWPGRHRQEQTRGFEYVRLRLIRAGRAIRSANEYSMRAAFGHLLLRLPILRGPIGQPD
jgi:hypothetical protein